MINITVPKVSDVTQAIKDQIRTYVGLQSVTVERSADRNNDPSGCPWIGIYRLSVDYEQKVLGFGGGIRYQRIQVLLLIEAANQESGEACEEDLEDLVSKVCAALLSDTTLRGTVGTIDGFRVDLEAYKRSSSVYMQTAALQFVAVGNTSATA